MFENWALKRIFGPMRDEVREEWVKLHNEWLNDPDCSPNITCLMKSRRKAWAGRVVRMGDRRDAYWVLVGKSEEKRPLARLRLG